MVRNGSIGNGSRKRKGDYMPTAKNMKQLNQMLMKNLQKALDEAIDRELNKSHLVEDMIYKAIGEECEEALISILAVHLLSTSVQEH